MTVGNFAAIIPYNTASTKSTFYITGGGAVAYGAAAIIRYNAACKVVFTGNGDTGGATRYRAVFAIPYNAAGKRITGNHALSTAITDLWVSGENWENKSAMSFL